MENNTGQLEQIHARLDRIERKLDDHLERVSQAEKDIEWLRGHVKLATAMFLSVVGAIGAFLLKYVFPFNGTSQ